MGDRLQTGEPSQYVTSHPGQLRLAIPPWVGAMSTSESWGVNRLTARYTSPVSVVSQCKLVSGWGLRKRRSAPPYGPLWLGKDFTFFTSSKCPPFDSMQGLSWQCYSPQSSTSMLLLSCPCSTELSLAKSLSNSNLFHPFPASSMVHSL